MHQSDTNLSKYSLMIFSPIKLNPELHPSPALLGLEKLAFMSCFLRFWSRSTAISGSVTERSLTFPRGHNKSSFGEPSFSPFPVSSLPDAICRALPIWHCQGIKCHQQQGWQVWEVGALSLLCPSHGVTLCFILCLQDGYFIQNSFGHFSLAIFPVFCLLTLGLALPSWMVPLQGSVGTVLAPEGPI